MIIIITITYRHFTARFLDRKFNTADKNSIENEMFQLEVTYGNQSNVFHYKKLTASRVLYLCRWM
jgi:hypothetical protein